MTLERYSVPGKINLLNMFTTGTHQCIQICPIGCAATSISKYPPKHDVAEWLTIQTLCDSERKGLGPKWVRMVRQGLSLTEDTQAKKKGCTFFIQNNWDLGKGPQTRTGVLATGRGPQAEAVVVGNLHMHTQMALCWQLVSISTLKSRLLPLRKI